ncbi:MAG: carboxypeptidase regulatory-like domain-containing protein [Myxococcales bacterium]|nr:carboxypeptidase regulatory-like domain-containing protein [Myxococcales bacterium]
MHKKQIGVFGRSSFAAMAFASAALTLGGGCAKKHVSMPHSTLGKVVIYRNGVAYYQRTARPVKGKLTVAVPRRLVDDFLKSLTIRDKASGASIGASFPRRTDHGDVVQMELALPPGTRDVVMTYITEAPAWKPSYRVSLPKEPGDTTVTLEGWAIVDNVSGEDWKQVLVGVGSSAAMSFRYDLWSVHKVDREQLATGELFAVAPPESVSPHRGIDAAAAAATPQIAGGMRGVAKDEKGKPLAGATVMIRSPGGADTIFITEEDGTYNATNLKPGSYTVSFYYNDAEVTQTGQPVGSGKTTVVNQVIPTSRGEVIVVSGQAPLIDLGSTKSGITISEDYVTNIPVGRSFSGSSSIESRYVVDGTNTSGIGYGRLSRRSRDETPRPPTAQELLRKEAQDIASNADVGSRGVKLMQYVAYKAQCDEQTKAQIMRDHLIDVGLNAAKVQVGCEVRPGSSHLDVQYVDIASLIAAGSGAPAAMHAGPPIGTALFMAAAPMSVAKDTSAMVSVMQETTEGEVVYLYDPSGARGNQAFAFRAVRLRNPTGAMLERGPVTFYGNGQFVGEGVTEPIAGHAAVVIPFALDRQVVVEHADTSTSEMTRFIGADRHGFRADIATKQTVAYTVTNRGGEATTVYLRHAVPLGYELGKEVVAEKVGDNYLIAVKVEAGASTNMKVTQSQTYARGYDFSDASALGLLRSYLKASPNVAEAPALAKIVAQGQALEILVEEITSLQERADEWAQREAELRAQIDSFRAAKAGASMLSQLTTRLGSVSRKAGELAIAMERAREKLLGERIRFVELVAEASAEASPAVASK